MAMTPEQRARWLPYYTLLGEALSTWDRLYGGLEHLFHALVDPNALMQPRAVFHSARSTQTQLHMLRNALETTRTKTANHARLSDLLDRVAESSRVRNAIVHANWVMVGYIDVPDNFIAVRLTALPNAILANNVLRSYVNRSNQFQKERSKFLYTTDRISDYIESLNTLVEEVWAAARETMGEEPMPAPSTPPVLLTTSPAPSDQTG